jgi:hypothetical protein
MTDKTRYAVELGDDCEHHICDCIKTALEESVLPASYDRGYADCGKHIIESLPIIIESYKKGMAQGLGDDEWIAAFSRRLLAFVESGLDNNTSKLSIMGDVPKSAKEEPLN